MTVKSDLMANIGNKVLNDQGHMKGVMGISAVVTTTGAVADNTPILFFEIPVDAIVDELILASDDLGTTGDINVGLYPGLRRLKELNIELDDIVDSDAVDENALGTAIDINAAVVTPTDIRFETKGLETMNQRAWELAGLSNRPSYDTFIVAATPSEATTAAGDIALRAVFRI